VIPAWADLAAEARITAAITITAGLAVFALICGIPAAIHAWFRAEPARPADSHNHGGDDGTAT
jgi:hypothetical protein